MTRPLPDPDLHTSAYWHHAAEGRFALPRCGSCGKYHFYPRGSCPHCGSADIVWVEASGRGEVYSFSVVYRAPDAAFANDVPYVVAIVRTEEGPHLLSRVVDVDPLAVTVGMKLKVKLPKGGEDLGLPAFAP